MVLLPLLMTLKLWLGRCAAGSCHSFLLFLSQPESTRLAERPSNDEDFAPEYLSGSASGCCRGDLDWLRLAFSLLQPISVCVVEIFWFDVTVAGKRWSESSSPYMWWRKNKTVSGSDHGKLNQPLSRNRSVNQTNKDSKASAPKTRATRAQIE